MKHVIVGTAGHIDHGKSALVRALTGTDPDRLKEEKERGITIDLGFAFLGDPSGSSLGFVDVPGHERFVKNMLAGAGGIDLVMLVVAADESIMPQTREHFDICRLLHVQRGIIAVTKVDLVDEDLRELAAMETRELVAGSFLENAPLVFVSSKTGEGIDALKRVLFEESEKIDARPSSGVFRLPIDRVFSMKGFGTVVTGTLVSGSVRVDEDVEIMPSGIRTRVRGLQVHGKSVDQASAGQRTAINLQGIEVSEIVRGDILARPQTLPASMMLDAKLDVLGTSPIAVKDLSRVHLHLGTAQVVCRIRVLGESNVITPGGDQLVQMRLEAPLVAAPGDRFIIRRYSPLETIGGGVILDAAPVKHSVSSVEVVEKLAALGEGDPREAAALFVSESGARGLTGSALSRRLGMDEEALQGIVRELLDGGRVHLVSRTPLLLVSPEVSDNVADRLLASLERFHEGNPLRDGMPKGELREKVTGGAPPEVFEWVLDRLVQSDKVRAIRDLVVASSHQIRLTPEESEVADLLKKVFRDGSYQPPTLAETASRSKKDLKLLERIERLLLQEGDLVRLSEGMVFHRVPLEELKDSVRKHKKKGETIDVGFFKQLAGVTRKHAIPLLEWLDREKVTRRVGKERIVL